MHPELTACTLICALGAPLLDTALVGLVTARVVSQTTALFSFVYLATLLGGTKSRLCRPGYPSIRFFQKGLRFTGKKWVATLAVPLGYG